MTKPKILLSLENHRYADRVEALLRRAEYEIALPADTGSETETTGSSDHCGPDLVLMDVPVRKAADVYAIACRMTSRFRVPVLCLASSEDHARLERLAPDEPIFSLLKPFRDRELLVALRNALRYHRAFCKKKREAIQESGDRCKWEFEQAPIGKALIGPDGRFASVNRALAELTGYSERELAGRSFHEVIVPDDGMMNTDQVRRLLVRNRRVYQTDGRCRHKRGQEVCVLLNFSLAKRRSGTFCPIILQVLDITARKRMEESLRQNEQRYRKLVEATTSYIFTVEVQGGVPRSTRHEEGCLFVTGYASREFDADPGLWYRMVHDDDRKEVVEQARRVITGMTASPLEHRIVHKDGSIRWVRNTPVSHFNDKGDLIAYDGLVMCITEERRLKDQLNQAQKMEAIGQLAGGMAHDFNNILTSIIAYGTLIDMSMEDDDPSKEDLGRLLDAADRAAALTGRLLTFSRKQSASPAPVKVNETIRRVESLLLPVIGEDIRLRHVPSVRDETIMADKCQLDQVLINLAANARDAMPGGGELTIETGTQRLDADFIKIHGFGEEGLFACLTVSDNGSGMTEQTRKRVFEPFFTTKEAGKGTGLGLAIVYGIVKQHRGYINIYSEPGQGTTIRIYLPLADAVVLDGPRSSPLVPAKGEETVLLAEDDELVRSSTKAVLEKYGYSVIEASEGEDAVAKYREHEKAVKLLILDVVMPKKTGKEVYDEIRKMNPNIKALFTSGYTEEMVRRKGIPARGVNFIPKPIAPASFSRIVREALDS